MNSVRSVITASRRVYLIAMTHDRASYLPHSFQLLRASEKRGALAQQCITPNDVDNLGEWEFLVSLVYRGCLIYNLSNP